MADALTAQQACLRERIAADLSQAATLFDSVESNEGHDVAMRQLGVKVATLRLINCAIKDRDAHARSSGDRDYCRDEAVRKVLETMARQRQVSAREFDEAGRISDAEREREELAVITHYMPKPLADAELVAAVQDVVTELEADTLKDLGKCMSTLKKRYPGKIDSKSAGKVVREALR